MNLREEIARLQAELDALPYSGELLAHKWQKLAELQRLRAEAAEDALYRLRGAPLRITPDLREWPSTEMAP